MTFISYIPIIAAIIWGSRGFLEGRLTPIIVSISSMALLTIAAGYYLRRMQEKNAEKK